MHDCPTLRPLLIESPAFIPVSVSHSYDYGAGHISKGGVVNGNGRHQPGLSITLDAFGRSRGHIIYCSVGEIARKQSLSIIFMI